MVPLALGLALLAALLWSANAFSRASVATIKQFLVWLAALAGLSLATLLVLSGRAGGAIGGLLLFGPLIWEQWQRHVGRRPPGPQARSSRPRQAAMSRAEALNVLGLQDPVSDADIRAAWVRLMRTAHPDGGGTDWLAARVNQAKDVLLRGR